MEIYQKENFGLAEVLLYDNYPGNADTASGQLDGK